MIKELLKGLELDEKPTANHPEFCRDLKVKSKIVWLFWTKFEASIKEFFHGMQGRLCEIVYPKRKNNKVIIFCQTIQ
jgi:hypothetical protein